MDRRRPLGKYFTTSRVDRKAKARVFIARLARLLAGFLDRHLPQGLLMPWESASDTIACTAHQQYWRTTGCTHSNHCGVVGRLDLCALNSKAADWLLSAHILFSIPKLELHKEEWWIILFQDLEWNGSLVACDGCSRLINNNNYPISTVFPRGREKVLTIRTAVTVSKERESAGPMVISFHIPGRWYAEGKR